MTRLTDEVVMGLLAGPYFLLVVLAVWHLMLRSRIRRLERKADLEQIQWRER